MKLFDPPNRPSSDDAARCASCNYALRGVESDKCPECGAVRWVALAQLDSHTELDEAAAALEHDGLAFDLVTATSNTPALHQTLWMGGALEKVGGGTVCVKRSDFKRAAAVLIVHFGEPARSIVDRAEPFCPACSAKLDPHGPDACPNCGKLFDWVEIEPGPIESVCTKCQYDLTGITSEYCPECGAYVRQLQEDSAELIAPPVESQKRLSYMVSGPAVILIAVLPLALIAVIIVSSSEELSRQGSLVALGLAVVISIAIVTDMMLRRLRHRRPK